MTGVYFAPLTNGLQSFGEGFVSKEIGREEGFSFCARHVKKEEQKTNVKQMQVSKMLKPICLKFVMGCLVRR